MAKPTITWRNEHWADSLGLADGAAVASWADLSGSGFHHTQALEASKPLFRPSVAALNGQAALEFDGTDDRLAQTHADIAQPFSMCFIGLLDTVAASQVFVSSHSTTSPSFALVQRGTSHADALKITVSLLASVGTAATATQDSSPDIVILTANGASSELRINGVVEWSGDLGTAVLNDGHIIGCQRATGTLANFSAGYVSYFALKSGTLTSGEKTSLETWFNEDYMIGSQLEGAAQAQSSASGALGNATPVLSALTVSNITATEARHAVTVTF